ncbi:transaldolase active site [Desulfoluna spongiiphila]|nr:transaldolase active site [Desulfoluna spongiiphila]
MLSIIVMNLLGRIPYHNNIRRNTFGNNGPRANYASFANCNSWQYYGVTSNPAIIINCNWFCRF